MADTIEYEEGFDFGGNTSDDANPIVLFRQDAQNLIDIVEAQGMTYENTITIIKALDLTYCPKYAYCFANDKLYEYVATSIATADDIDVLMPTSLVGRWVKIKDYSTSVGVTKSYVDLQDAATLQAANDYTDAYCEEGAEVNDIASISVNSVNVVPDGNRNVDITVPENTSDLNNDDNFVADANYVHTDNNYDNAAVNKLAGIATGAQVNVIETVKVNDVALPIVGKAVNITTTKGDQGDSAYDVAVEEGFDGSQSEWVASLQGKNGTLWKYTAITLVVGSDVLVNDLIAPFNVDDLVMSTDNNVWGIIKSIAGTDAVVTGLGQGGADGTNGTDGEDGADGANIFIGTDVTGTGSGISASVIGSKAGDYYKNSTTSFFYQASAPDTWDYKGSDKGEKGDDGVVDPSALQSFSAPMEDTDLVLVVRGGELGTLTALEAKNYFRSD